MNTIENGYYCIVYKASLNPRILTTNLPLDPLFLHTSFLIATVSSTMIASVV
jgi:hypothetical protein